MGGCSQLISDVVKLLLPHAPAAYLQKVNEAGSPAIHWAVMNNHVEIVIELANIPEEKGGGLPLVKVGHYDCLY